MVVSNRFPVAASLRVSERSARRVDPLRAQLGNEIRVDPKLLTDYCFSSIDGLTHDLMAVLGAVRWADRSVLRRPTEGWGRSIELEIPVLEHDSWGSQRVLYTLEDCLNFLTGDVWSFHFTKRRNNPQDIRQAVVQSQPPSTCVFVPYSHGLDSYAQVRILENNEADTDVVCVFTDSRPSDKTWKEFCRQRPRGGVRAIGIPVDVVTPRRAEPTFRTRPFLYYALAATGALRSSKRVLIPENGQGSLGGSLVPLGGEARHRSCHPGFTHRLARFLGELTGETLRFEHPALFQTKGQVLRMLLQIDKNSQSWLSEHRSCSHDQRHASVDGRRVHCGVCGNCILRRMSVDAAATPDPTEYLFRKLAVGQLTNGHGRSGKAARGIKAFSDLAGNTVRSMQRFASLASNTDHPAIWGEAVEVAEAQGRKADDVQPQIVSLIQTHAEEWAAFLAANRGGWLSTLAEDSA